VPHRMSIDRYEGEKKEIAVLVTDDGQQINMPRALLPRGCKAGDVLTVTMERDAKATKDVAEKTRKLQEDLKGKDPGGDMSL
jgi:Protein of unknown function (DUF3006)